MKQTSVIIGHIVLAALILTAPLSAKVDFQSSGNNLLEQLELLNQPLKDSSDVELMKSYEGLGYVTGLSTALDFSSLICIPANGVSNGQRARIVRKFLNDHPERLHEFQFFLAREALIDAFPCKSAD